MNGLLGGTGEVGVFDAEEESAALVFREEPVEEGGACAAYVEVAGWGRGEAGDDLVRRGCGHFWNYVGERGDGKVANDQRAPRSHMTENAIAVCAKPLP